jgi:hypothetical protein
LVPYQQIPVAPNYQVPLLNKLKKKEAKSNRAVGLMKRIKQKKLLALEKQIWFCLRVFKRSNLALTFARDLKEDIAWPKQYERAKK